MPIGRLAAAVVALAVVWNLVGNLALPGAWYVPANLAVAAVLVGLAHVGGLGWSELGVGRDGWGRGIAIGLAAMAVVGFVIAILVAIPATRSFFESGDVVDDGAAERWFVALVRIPLGTAVFEEVLFRSVLFAVLLRLLPPMRAVTVDAVLFGLWHVVPAWETAEGPGWAIAGAIVGTVIVTAVAGTAFALLRWWSGSVAAPILAHTASNSFAYAAAIVALDWASLDG